MPTLSIRNRLGRVLAVASAAGCLLGAAVVPAHASTPYVNVDGSGDTWSQNALEAWRVDVQASGIPVTYSGVGATAGRLQFIQGLADFAVSPIPFQLHPEDGSSPEVSKRPYAYLPVVAGGTSLMYHLTLGGRQITNLRLSGETVTKIFTGAIKSWNDPEIEREYGGPLPNEPIVPVIRADGSGTSAEFSLYMSKMYPSLWNSFCAKYAHVSPPCGMFSFYPQFPGSKAQTGSNGVADYVAASYGEGAITYVEYSYALNLGYPVVKLLNAAGYYTLPTASNVAVALTQAQINPSDLTQILDNVYVYKDPRTYPLSNYDYLIVPTDTTAPFTTDKGRTLSTFIDYSVCQGQQKAPTLGYSPLPLNLVQAAFRQVQRIPGNVGVPPLSDCHNPTFVGGVNTLLKYGPMPSPCDKVGVPLNCTVAAGGIPTTTGTRNTHGGGSATTATTRTTSTGTSASAGVASTAAGTAKPGTKATTVNPLTGQQVTDTGTATVQTALAQSVAAPSADLGSSPVFIALAVGELLLVLIAPPLVAMALRRRKASRA